MKCFNVKCQKEFNQTSRNQKYCCVECRKAMTESKRQRSRLPVNTVRTCQNPECARPFQITCNSQVYCCPFCRKKDHERIARQKRALGIEAKLNSLYLDLETICEEDRNLPPTLQDLRDTHKILTEFCITDVVIPEFPKKKDLYNWRKGRILSFLGENRNKM